MKSRNTKFSSAMIFASVVAISSVALAGDVDVIGEGTHALEVVNTYSGSSSRYAVYATLANYPGKGYGGYFAGGYTGVKGHAEMPGSGYRYGVRGHADGGSANYGVYGVADGSHNYAGYFNGDVVITGAVNPSDENLKDEIIDLGGSLDQIMELKPKSFRFRTEEHPQMHLPKGYHAGLLGQEVERVFPDLVRDVPYPEDEQEDDTANEKPKTFLGVNYVELIPVLIGAIQEQQEQIAELQGQVAGCGCR